MFSDPEKVVSQVELTPRMHVADFGAGAGYYSILLGKALHGTGAVYACDVNDDLLKKIKNAATRERVHNIHIVCSDIEKLGGTQLKDNSIDVVLVTNTLFQVKNREALIGEARRILKKKGTLYIVDWKDSFEGIGPHPDDIFPETVARAMIEKAGFMFHKMVSAGEHHYGLAFKKI